ncbi:MAG: hypothetical protein VYC39_15550 [Myxococcota bacterium]|nr:hypothetical protein [Myxococcota bacterium]
MNRLRLPFALITSVLMLSGCGFDTLQETVKLRLNFSVISDKGAFESEEIYRPDDNEDIRNNRDRIEQGEIQIRNMSVVLTRIGQTNAAKFAWGKVYVAAKADSAAVDYEIDRARPCKESKASACFEAIPLIPTDTTDQDSNDRGGLTLDMTTEQKSALIDLIFNQPELSVKVVGWTDKQSEPTDFDVDVIFTLDITASLL